MDFLLMPSTLPFGARSILKARTNTSRCLPRLVLSFWFVWRSSECVLVDDYLCGVFVRLCFSSIDRVHVLSFVICLHRPL